MLTEKNAVDVPPAVGASEAPARGARDLAPFVHRFRTDRQTYLFDVNTGHILRVPLAVWHIVGEYGLLPKEDLVKRFSGQFSSSDVEAAYEAITLAQSDGLLLARRPEGIAIVDRAYLEGAAENRCQGLVLSVTEDCNFRCTYCVYSGRYPNWRIHARRSMVWGVAKAAIDDYLRHSGHWKTDRKRRRYVDFYGGEPLLNLPLIQQAVRYIRQQPDSGDVGLYLTTNGFLLTGAAADFLASEDFVIDVSVDGPQHVHDRCRRQRNGAGTWDTVVTNVTHFVDKYPRYRSNRRLRINCTMTPPTNATEITTFFAAHRVFSCVPCTTSLAYAGGRSQSGSGMVEREPVLGMRKLRDQYLENLRAGSIQANPDAPRFQLLRALFDSPFAKIHRRDVAGPGCVLHTCVGPRSMCIAGVHKTFVTVDGDYYPCETVPPLECVRVGDVWSGRDLDKIQGLMQQFYRINGVDCPGCWCVRHCHVGCCSALIENGGLTENVKREACARYREHMHDILVSYCAIKEVNSQAFDYLSRASGVDPPLQVRDEQ